MSSACPACPAPASLHALAHQPGLRTKQCGRFCFVRKSFRKAGVFVFLGVTRVVGPVAKCVCVCVCVCVCQDWRKSSLAHTRCRPTLASLVDLSHQHQWCAVRCHPYHPSQPRTFHRHIAAGGSSPQPRAQSTGVGLQVASKPAAGATPRAAALCRCCRNHADMECADRQARGMIRTPRSFSISVSLSPSLIGSLPLPLPLMSLSHCAATLPLSFAFLLEVSLHCADKPKNHPPAHVLPALCTRTRACLLTRACNARPPSLSCHQRPST
jgi:hypothetical protein